MASKKIMITLRDEIVVLLENRAQEKGMRIQELIRSLLGDWYLKEKMTTAKPLEYPAKIR